MSLLGYTSLHCDPRFVPYMLPPGQFDFAHHYDRHDSVSDIPTAYYYEEMLRVYPTAKFVLTVRDPEAWYSSFSAHCRAILSSNLGVLPLRVKRLHDLVYGTWQDDKATWVAHYAAHNARVQQVVPKARLLVIDVSDALALGELCDFLHERTGPCVNPRLFPRANSQTERESIEAARQAWMQSIRVNNPTTRYAYVSSLAPGERPDRVLSAVSRLRSLGAQMDVVVALIGRQHPTAASLLTSGGCKLLDLSFWPASRMYDTNRLAKSLVFGLVQYSAVLYFDAGAVFKVNADEMFPIGHDHVFSASARSPLNASIFIARPSLQVLVDLVDTIEHFLETFTVAAGWARWGRIPQWATRAEGTDSNSTTATTDWSFERAASDNGLLYYYFLCVRRGDGTKVLDPRVWGDRITASE